MTGSSVSVIDLVHRHVGQQHPVRVEKIAIEAGEKVAIMGPSGCGKTTLLSCIAGILSPSSGEVQVGEIRIDQLSDARRRKFRREHIGLVFQEFELLEHIDVMENSFLPLWLDGREPTEEEQAKLIERSRRCGISQGERQRAAVCRALMTSPSLILADEPTGSLDGASGRAVLDLLFEEADLTGATVIVVTHDSTILDGFDRVEALAGSAS
jgi:putative ABC transport system ATP-binding protein